MPLIAYDYKAFRGDSLAIIRQANIICQDYANQGYSLTLRQLYYRFVAQSLIPNTDKSYKRLGNIVNDARMAGLIDWFHVVDRTRTHVDHGGWESPEQIVNATADGYRRNPWVASEQTFRPEVWVEKEALADVISQACQTYSVPHFACRGYVSQSAMWRAGRRMKRTLGEGHTPVVIHLGDHDPSGIDMSRDIEDRLYTFAGPGVRFIRIALNMDQIEQYQPPPNPAKMSDARANKYVEEYGDESWELDALPPEVLDELINDEVRNYLDLTSFEQVDVEDEEERDRLRRVASRWSDISDRWDEIEELLEA
jgi:hypothetical protein